MVRPDEPEVPDMPALEVDLDSYNELLAELGETAS